MPLPTFHCLVCDKDFKAGQYQCETGDKHVVAPRIFYIDDAPSDPREFRNARTVILNVIPERDKVDKDTGKVHTVPGQSVEFVRGSSQAISDPEMQYNLEALGKCCTKDRWEQVYFTDYEKQQLAKIRLENDNSRLEQENNSLLAQIQDLKRKVPIAQRPNG